MRKRCQKTMKSRIQQFAQPTHSHALNPALHRQTTHSQRTAVHFGCALPRLRRTAWRTAVRFGCALPRLGRTASAQPCVVAVHSTDCNARPGAQPCAGRAFSQICPIYKKELGFLLKGRRFWKGFWRRLKRAFHRRLEEEIKGRKGRVRRRASRRRWYLVLERKGGEGARVQERAPRGKIVVQRGLILPNVFILCILSIDCKLYEHDRLNL